MFGDRRRLVFREEAREQLKQGIDTLADAVEVTLGPRGGNVILERIYNASKATKDGVSVARDIFLEHPVQNIGCQTIKQAAEKTAEDAGDGTTTSTVLARAIYSRALRYMEQGCNSTELKKGVEYAVSQLVEMIKSNSHSITTLEELIDIAIISANGDEELGTTIAKAVHEIGASGTVVIEESKDSTTYSEIIKGTVIDRGFISQYFATNVEQQELILENPIIIVSNSTISNPTDLELIFKHAAQHNRSVLIIMEELDKLALSYALDRIGKGLIKGAIISPPGISTMRNFMLDDLAIITGATFVDRFKGHNYSQLTDKHFGSAEKVIVTRKKTVIINGAGNEEKINARKALIENDIKQAEKNIDSRHKERLARMFSGVSTLYVGGTTEVEKEERKDRVDDAIRATQSALAEGYVPGGGITLYKLSNEIDSTTDNTESFNTGIELVKNACKVPFQTIVKNTGASIEVVEANLKAFDKKFNLESGYNARTGEMSKNLIKDGIIDPAKVTRVALENAASVASLLFTTNCVVYYKDDQHERMNIDPGNVR